MKDKFKEFIELCIKSNELDPWAREQGLRGYANEIILEAQELLEAIDNDDQENIHEELGDVLIDWAHSCINAGVDIRQVMQDAMEKLNRRKPFLAEGKTVSIEEAAKIWKRVKEEEKNGTG